MSSPQLELFAMPAGQATHRHGRGDAMRVANEKEVLWPPEVMHLDETQRVLLFGDIPRETRLSVRQVCRRLGCDSNTVTRRIQSGELVAANIGTEKRPCYRVYRWSLVRHIYKQLEGDWSE